MKEAKTEEDQRNETLVFHLNNIANINKAELSQDDVYDLYLKYLKYFEAKTEEDKIRLKYLKVSFVSKLIT